MTDNEIIKALECCKMFYAEHNNYHCNNCPLNDCKECETTLFANTLDLINRQQADIERLQNAYKQCAWERDAFVGDFEELVAKEISILKMDINTIKAEAIKEFAERLKKQIYIKEDRDFYGEKIDNLVKEMVGEE